MDEAVTGVVASFDDAVGIGVLRSDDGREFPFHCTAIADGSRTITEGAEVRALVIPGHLGQWEVANICPKAD
jgi:cold shock CspA family protein